MTLVIVTDGAQRAALAAVRSLGRSGHEVVCIEGDGPRLAGASKWVRRRLTLPPPRNDPRAFAESIGAAARTFGAGAILPITEASALALLDHPEACRGFPLLLPDSAAFRLASGKVETLGAAEAVGIRVPGQRVVTDPGAGAPAAQGLSFPLVIKPGRSVSEIGDRRVGYSVRHAADAVELGRILAETPNGAYPLLLQERVVGPGTGIFVLLWEGRLVAAFAHRRLREKPPAGGVSVYSESVPLDADLLRESLKLLGRLGFRSGVAMIEYKRRSADGAPFLMEINPRLWGSLQLAIDCGVDFPRLFLDAALGRPLPAEPPPYVAGRRSRWWWGDVDRLFTLLRHSRTTLHLPPDVPSRWRTLVEFCRPNDLGWRGSIFRWNDPWPWLHESLSWVRAAVGAIRRGDHGGATLPAPSL